MFNPDCNKKGIRYNIKQIFTVFFLRQRSEMTIENAVVPPFWMINDQGALKPLRLNIYSVIIQHWKNRIILHEHLG